MFPLNVSGILVLILLVQRTNGKSIKNAVCIFYKGGSTFYTLAGQGFVPGETAHICQGSHKSMSCWETLLIGECLSVFLA